MSNNNLFTKCLDELKKRIFTVIFIICSIAVVGFSITAWVQSTILCVDEMKQYGSYSGIGSILSAIADAAERDIYENSFHVIATIFFTLSIVFFVITYITKAENMAFKILMPIVKILQWTPFIIGGLMQSNEDFYELMTGFFHSHNLNSDQTVIIALAVFAVFGLISVFLCLKSGETETALLSGNVINTIIFNPIIICIAVEIVFFVAVIVLTVIVIRVVLAVLSFFEPTGVSGHFVDAFDEAGEFLGKIFIR